MSIDFDSAALQTQHEEEEYDPEDYAREQELHKLLTDLPDDMLEDSRDDSSPELDNTACSNQDTGNRQQPTWNQNAEWPDQQRPASHEENYEDNYDQGSYHGEYPYEDGTTQVNGHASHPQQGQPLPHAWNQQGQEYQYNQGGYAYTTVGTDMSAASNDFSTEQGYEHEPYPHGAINPGVEYHQGVGGQRNEQNYGDQNHTRKQFQKFDSGGSGDRQVDHYKTSCNPYQPANQPVMFNSEAPHQNGQFDQLQRDFLDSVQSSNDSQQLAQQLILNKAQLRQIEDFERKLEDSRRNMRYLEHQFAIVKDEKEGLAVTLKESSRVLEEAKGREVQLLSNIKSLELQVQALTERDHEHLKKQRVADAEVDCIKQQMMELCRSDSLSRARENHDRDLSSVREQHEAKVLTLQREIDACTQALEEQGDAGQRLRQQVRQLERRGEEEQVERAGVINALTQRLEESQQQCAKLLQTGSVQEMSQMQIKLQQLQSAKTMNENMNKALQEDVNDLKEQITLYESAVKHGVITPDTNGDWENQLSDSYVDLGIKKVNWKNGRLHGTVLADLSDPKLPREEVLRELRTELQRCLASLKGKRLRIGQLQEELQLSQARVDELQTQLDRDTMVRKNSLEKHPEQSTMTAASHTELLRLQEDQQRLQEHVETLEERNKELKLGEEKVRSANSELCKKMREMIQELDQEKQEAAERSERTQQQFRDDVVNRVRAELTLEHTEQLELLTAEYQLQVQQLQSKLSEVTGEMLTVQECYISVCKEKDRLDDNLQSRTEKEAEMRENELRIREESRTALEELRTGLETEHLAAVTSLKALCSKEKETEVQQQLLSRVASAKATWQAEQQKMERAWAQRLEEAVEEARRGTHTETVEEASQTDPTEPSSAESFSREELDSRLSAQRLRLQQEADTAKRRAVEEAGKRVQRELQEKHLGDMAKQVEGAVTRAYSRWLEDLTSLPEYKTNLRREQEKWEKQQDQHVEEQLSLALRVAEDRWQERHHRAQLEEQGEGAQKVEQLQEEVASLQSQLQRVREEQAALLKAELAVARAAWNRDKQQEVSSIQTRDQQDHRNQLEQTLQQAREEADRQRKELTLQKEAELQQALRAREEEWRGLQESKGQAQRQQGREEALAELQAGLAEVQALLLRETTPTERQSGGEGRRASPTAPEGTIRHILQSTCKDMLSKAVAKAKREWKKIGEDRLGRVLKETQERHEKDINQIHNSVAQRREEARCGKQCAEAVGKLQKRSQDLQRHLEKACRQLQLTVRENKASMQRLKDEHADAFRKEIEDNRLKLEEVKRSSSEESSRCSDDSHHLQAGLEEMKEQYMKAVEKIRGDMLRYLQESKERAGEVIRLEVLRERQDTARKMRRYYLTCLQELLEEGAQATGAEKKIMNAASKLAAMARVLETPTKRKSGKNHSLQSPSTKTHSASDSNPGGASGSASNKKHFPVTQVPEARPGEERTGRSQTHTESLYTTTGAVRTRVRATSKSTHQDPLMCGKEKAPKDAASKQPQVPPAHFLSHKIVDHASSVDGYHGDFTSANVTLRNQGREMYLQGVDSGQADDHFTSESLRKPFLIQEPPVRDDGQSDWSSVSDGSQVDGQTPNPDSQIFSSYPGRKMEAVKPFYLGGPSTPDDRRGFGSLTADNSDVTVYKEIVNIPSHTKALTFPSVKASTHREPIPGSEGDRQHRLCTKSLFSELRLCQQDSGFDSPFSHQN